MTTTRFGIVTTLCAAVLMSLVSGCAQDIGTVDRVQPDVQDKRLFTGEFYFRQTVVDSPSSGAYSFPGDTNTMTRGVFDIQEHTLYFYRTYEFTEGTDIRGFRSDKDTPLCIELKSGETLSGISGGDPVAVRRHLEWCNDHTSDPTEATHQLVTRKVMLCGAEQTVPVVVFKKHPIAAWPIISHFDILRNYNPSTGEDTTVIGENTSDRYWKDRGFMRVDFAANSVNSAFSLGGLAPYTNFAIYEGDSAHPDEQPRYEDVEGNPIGAPEDLAYFDFLTDHVLMGATTYLDGYGVIPFCAFYPWYTGGAFECTSERIRVRTAFWRTDKVIDGKPSDYKALDYDDVHLGKFGFYRAARQDYDCAYTSTYTGAHRKAIRHRIWNQYVENANGDLDYSQMTPRPLVYYMSEGYPRDLVEGSLQLAREWSEPFDDVVKVRKGAPANHPMFILCENSDAEAKKAADRGLPTACWSGSSESWCSFCERMDRPHERGDLRYNYLAAVTEPLQAGLYGFGPPSWDPISGEILSANAYNYTAPMRLGARSAIDLVELFAGVKDWREAEEADDRIAENNVKRLRINGERPFMSVSKAQKMARGLIDPDVAQKLKALGLNTTDRDVSSERLARLHDMPELEELLTGDHVRMLFGDPRVGSGHMLNDEERKAYSLASFKHHGGHVEKLKYYREMSEKNLYLAEFADDAILGLAREFGKKYDRAVCAAVAELPDPAVDLSQFDDANPCTTRKVVDALAAEIRRVDQTSPFAVYVPKALWTPTDDDRIHETQMAIRDTVTELRGKFQNQLWQDIYYAVAEHEVGHNLGLRHNFEGSADPMNYFADYWDLRGKTEGGEWQPVSLICDDDEGRNCRQITGEPFGGETERQAANKMRQLQNSSIMDYGAKFNSDFEGVGLYDKAAIRYGYGQLVETFTQTPNVAPYLKYLEDPTTQNFGAAPASLPDHDPMVTIFRKAHYKEIPNLFGGNPAAIYDRTLVGTESFTGTPCDIRDNRNACGGGEYCAHFFHGDFCVPVGGTVPYRFCSDERAGTTPTCDRWDEGANIFEVVRNAFDNYENYWPFWGFQRDSVLFNPSNYAGRVYRVFKKGQMAMQYWLAEYTRFNHEGWWASRNGVPYEEDVNGGLGGTQATAITFNNMAQALGRPILGWYAYHQNNDRYEPYSRGDSEFFDSTSFVWVGEEAGARQMYPNYDYGGYLPVIRSAGAIYDRLNAFEVLTDPMTFFESPYVGHATGEQSRRYLASFYTIFPRQVTELLGSLMADDHSRFGWCVRPNPEATDDFIDARRRSFVGLRSGECSGEEQAIFPEPRYTFPTTKFRIPAYAALYGMAFMAQDYDHTFLDMTHIFLRGHEDAVSAPAGATTTAFEDPLSGKIYEAIRFPDDTFYDPATALIEQANTEFQGFENTEYYLSRLQYLVGKLELIRGMNRNWGSY